jgi:hypothetical protein
VSALSFNARQIYLPKLNNCFTFVMLNNCNNLKTDGLVYLLFCIYDRYEILLCSLVYFFVVNSNTSSVQICYKNRSSCLQVFNFELEF